MVDVRHQVEHAMLFNTRCRTFDGDVVAGLDGLRASTSMCAVDDDHVAHLACAGRAPRTPGVRGSSGGMRCTFIVRRTIHQVVQRVPVQTPAHAAETAKPTIKAPQSGRGWVASEVADDAGMPTTSEEAASERACQALAMSMLDLTRLATASM